MARASRELEAAGRKRLHGRSGPWSAANAPFKLIVHDCSLPLPTGKVQNVGSRKTKRRQVRPGRKAARGSVPEGLAAKGCVMAVSAAMAVPGE